MPVRSDKRYQVFVSSTYEDLKRERQAVIQALLELGHMPAGMELFPATNQQQWELIQREIDSCDYYVVVLGGRYGSIGPDGMGYTEKEYRYALEINKPSIAFLHKDPESLPVKRTEKTDSGKQRYAEFRKLLESKLCKHWRSPAELSKAVAVSLVELVKTTTAPGWVRADNVPTETGLLGISHCLPDIMATIQAIPESEELLVYNLGLDMSIAGDYVGNLLRGCRARSMEFNLLTMSDSAGDLGVDAPEEVKLWSTYVPGSIARIKKHVTDFCEGERRKDQSVRVAIKKYCGVSLFHGVIIQRPKRLTYLSIARFRAPDYVSYDWGEFAFRRIDRSRASKADQDLADVLEGECLSRWKRTDRVEWSLQIGPKYPM